tara:strand:- start:7415 stop:8140 length:726 start_codon:yes stop_codon:yes gene_type:complete
MAGHSKWANIKHRKGAQDKKRSKIFSRIIKEITISAKSGGPDINSNPRLRLAIQNAKGANMPKDNIERAIKKATSNDAGQIFEINFEGYGPHGVAIFIECATDNKNRTVSNIRAVFSKNGGSLGVNGSLDFIFNTIGIFQIDKDSIQTNLEDLEMILIDYGLEDLENEGDKIILLTSFHSFGLMQTELEKMEIKIINAEVHKIPKEYIKLDKEKTLKILTMIEKFEEEEDVQNVFHNIEIN